MSYPFGTMAIMSHDISYTTADKADVTALLGSGGGDLTSDQRRRLADIRGDAQAHQADLEHQGVDWGLSIPDALDHLLAGHSSSDAERAGNAYHAALQHIIDHSGSDAAQLGTYSQPATFFGLVDEEMRRLGVPADLLPGGFLFGNLPGGFPFLPGSIDGYPAIGHLPLASTKSAADAYRAVLDRLNPDFRHDVHTLIRKMDIEHESWEYATEKLDWYTQDTIFFSLT